MATFRITYTDPESGKEVVEEKDFHDSHDPHFISAKDWAEDYAYGRADKGPHNVVQVVE
jgi:hypothetical protein